MCLFRNTLHRRHHSSPPLSGRDRAIAKPSPSRRRAAAEPSPSVTEPSPSRYESTSLEILNKLSIYIRSYGDEKKTEISSQNKHRSMDVGSCAVSKLLERAFLSL